MDESLEGKVSRLDERSRAQGVTLDEVRADVKAIKAALDNGRGRVWGVSFAVSLIWGVGLAVWQFLP